MTAAAGKPPASTGRPPFADASPAQLRAALISEDAAEFDRQWREVTTRATENFDLAEVLATLESWRRIAWLTSANGPEGYRRILAKAEHLQRTGELPAETVPWRQLKVELGLPE